MNNYWEDIYYNMIDELRSLGILPHSLLSSNIYYILGKAAKKHYE